MKADHYTINLGLQSCINAMLEERERRERKELAAWLILIGFLLTLHVGAFRLIFSWF